MAKYTVQKDADGVDIQVTMASERQPQLLAAFEECQAGHCTCPTDEYVKLDDMTVAAADGEVTLHLKAKPGTEFDTAEISRCLDYTVSKVREP